MTQSTVPSESINWPLSIIEGAIGVGLLVWLVVLPLVRRWRTRRGP